MLKYLKDSTTLDIWKWQPGPNIHSQVSFSLRFRSYKVRFCDTRKKSFLLCRYDFYNPRIFNKIKCRITIYISFERTNMIYISQSILSTNITIHVKNSENYSVRRKIFVDVQWQLYTDIWFDFYSLFAKLQDLVITFSGVDDCATRWNLIHINLTIEYTYLKHYYPT